MRMLVGEIDFVRKAKALDNDEIRFKVDTYWVLFAT